MTLARRDRYHGCLIGLACGDALGGPFEFLTREQMDADHPNGVHTFTGGGWLDLAPGEITDDTQMTLAIARSLAETGEIDIDDIAQRFVAWMASDPKDIGNTTRASINLLAAGVPWSEAGAQVARAAGKSSAGNGAVMRCAPVAMRLPTDADARRTASVDVTRTTHADPHCTDSAVVLNTLIAHLLTGDDLETAIDAGRSEATQHAVRQAMAVRTDTSREEIRSGGYVVDTLQAAVWSVLTTSSFEDAVVVAVGLGGDTDTTAAVAGALAGALYGIDAIPVAWRETVQHREELTTLADRLLELARLT